MSKWTCEQMAAINLDNSNIIVSAGAGAGKTAVLSERVIRKVKSGVNIDELLILTFTNAAAKEMKDRIRKKLLQNNLTEQLDRLDNAYITTFDAYALSIVRKYSHLLNIDENVSICEQSIMDIKKGEILDEVFIEMYDDLDFQRLIDDFCTKDDKEIKKYIRTINNKLDMIYNKEAYLSGYNNKYYGSDFIDNNINLYVELLLGKVNHLNSLLAHLKSYVDGDYYEKVEMSLESILSSKTYDDFKHSNYKLPMLPRNSEEKAKEIKSSISKLLTEIEDMCSYNDIGEIKQQILKTKDYVKSIINIINRFDSKLNNYKSTNDLYEFIDIEKMAIKLLEQNKYIREELNYNEIMIDEYQDTNDLQELFISFIENNNVYMVGDIKQSIYRFRNANPNLFKEKYDNYSHNINGLKIDLNKNFRSRIEVIDNINQIFNIIMDNLIGGADYKESHQMIYGNTIYSENGRVTTNSNLEVLSYDLSNEYRKNEIEAFIIASDIKNKVDSYEVFDKEESVLRKLTYSDIVILMDRATDFDLYKKIFEYMGIPLMLYKDELINDNVNIGLIKNIIGFMITTDEKVKQYSFMSILRSYLFKLDDNTIFNYIINKDYSFLDDYKINLNNSTPKDIIDHIIQKFDIYNNLIKIGNIDENIAVLDYLIDIAGTLTNMGYDIFDFYDYLNDIIEGKTQIKYLFGSGNGTSVKIMTIHKSKGLEFPICYYSGLTSSFNIDDLKDKFIYDNELGFITPTVDNGIRNTIYHSLLKDSYLKDDIAEKIRLFYVALTRAEEKMLIILPNKETNIDGVDYYTKIGYKSFADIVYSILPKLDFIGKVIDINGLEITHNYNLIKKTNYQNQINEIDEKIIVSDFNIKSNVIDKKILSKKNESIYSIKDYNNIEFGKHIHYVFEKVDFKNPDYSTLLPSERERLEKFIKSNLFKDVINIYKEYEFIYDDDSKEIHGFIDLLLEYENEFKIIDYKLKDINDEAYFNQLKGYKKYIERVTNKPVNTYLYSILDDELVEII